MIKCFNKIRKPCFWSIFGPFSKFWGQNKKFLENPAMSSLTFYGFLATCQNLEKTNDAILKKTPRQTEGRTERRRTYPGTAGGPIITEACNLSHGYTLPLSFTARQTLKIYAANFRFSFFKKKISAGDSDSCDGEQNSNFVSSFPTQLVVSFLCNCSCRKRKIDKNPNITPN